MYTSLRQVLNIHSKFDSHYLELKRLLKIQYQTHTKKPASFTQNPSRLYMHKPYAQSSVLPPCLRAVCLWSCEVAGVISDWLHPGATHRRLRRGELAQAPLKGPWFLSSILSSLYSTEERADSRSSNTVSLLFPYAVLQPPEKQRFTTTRSSAQTEASVSDGWCSWWWIYKYNFHWTRAGTGDLSQSQTSLNTAARLFDIAG